MWKCEKKWVRRKKQEPTRKYGFLLLAGQVEVDISVHIEGGRYSYGKISAALLAASLEAESKLYEKLPGLRPPG